MSEGGHWGGVSRRRKRRFHLHVPIDVIITRAGNSDTVPGRAVNVCENGIAAILAGELQGDQTIEIKVRFPGSSTPWRANAKLRYQTDLRCGFEFLDISPAQRVAIQSWAKETRAELESATVALIKKGGKKRWKAEGATGERRRRRLLVAGAITALVLILGGGVFWWKWSRGWRELEGGVKSPEAAFAGTARVQVPAEVMQRLIVHRVEPVYPPEARKQGLQGVIAIHLVVGADGSVVGMRPLNGPDVLARAAMEALRWWKFDPYRVSGEPIAVETTMAVEFKR